MASYNLDPQSGFYRIRFRYHGKNYQRSLKTREERVANARCDAVEEMIGYVERGLVKLPERVDVAEWLISGGRLAPSEAAAPVDTVGALLDAYTREYTKGAKAKTTTDVEHTHRKHLRRLLEEGTPLSAVTHNRVQRYANARSEEGVKPDTIAKELSTLRAIWNWATRQGFVSVPLAFQVRHLTFARTEEKPPFRTRAEIEAILKRGGLTRKQEKALWESLYLATEEIKEVLELVKDRAAEPWIHPMFAMAAMTGARRSEICRARIEDFDFEARVVHLREQKRVKGKSSFRGVDLHPRLAEIMTAWFAIHPGGVCAVRGRELTFDMAQRHFRTTLRGTKWRVIPGFHTFRHSFASNLAAAGVDARVIDGFMGHQTLEQRRRYLHLFPKDRKTAIDSLGL